MYKHVGRVAGDSVYMNEDNQRLCIQCLLKMLQHLPPASSSSDLMQCKVPNRIFDFIKFKFFSLLNIFFDVNYSSFSIQIYLIL